MSFLSEIDVVVTTVLSSVAGLYACRTFLMKPERVPDKNSASSRIMAIENSFQKLRRCGTLRKVFVAGIMIALVFSAVSLDVINPHSQKGLSADSMDLNRPNSVVGTSNNDLSFSTDNIPSMTTRMQGSIDNVVKPIGLAYDNNSGIIYAVAGGNVSLFSDENNSFLMNASFGEASYSLIYSSEVNEVFVTSVFGVAQINCSTNSMSWLYLDGSGSFQSVALVFDPYNHILYVGNFGDSVHGLGNSLLLINVTTGNVVKILTVGPVPSGIVFDPANRLIYVASFWNGNVSVVSTLTNTVTGQIATGSSDWLVYDASNGLIYAGEANNVTLINTTTNRVTASIPLPVQLGCNVPNTAAFDPTDNLIFAPETYYGNTTPSDEVLVINTTSNQVVDSITVGSNPDGAVYDGGNSEVYVSNHNSNNISVIKVAQTYAATFVESGLPSGTTWYVNLSNDRSHLSSTSAISFPERNGTYSYTVADSNRSFDPSLGSGSFTVNGANVSENISFSVPSAKVHSNFFIENSIVFLFIALAIFVLVALIISYRRRRV